MNYKEGLRRLTWVVSSVAGIVGGLILQSIDSAGRRSVPFEERLVAFLFGAVVLFLLVWVIYFVMRWIKKGLEMPSEQIGDQSTPPQGIAVDTSQKNAIDTTDEISHAPRANDTSIPDLRVEEASEDNATLANDTECTKATAVIVKEHENPEEPKKHDGIGGWLLLFGFLLALGLIQYPFQIIFLIISLNTPSVGLFVLPEAEMVLWLQTAIDIALFVYLIVVAVRFFSQKRNAPSTVKRYLKLRLVLFGVVLFLELSNGLYEFAGVTIGGIGIAAIVAAIWIPYFNRSQRVAITFIKD